LSGGELEEDSEAEDLIASAKKLAPTLLENNKSLH